MLAALAAAAILTVASLVVGQAVLALVGAPRWTPLAAGVGLAAWLVVCGLGGRVVVGALVAAAAVVVLVALNGGHVGGRGPGGAAESEGDVEFFPEGGNKSTLAAIGAALLAVFGAAIPFIVNDRVGVLGAGLVNDDMANHLLMADWAQNGTEPRPELIDDGYPLGPHSIAATLADLLGTGLVEAFAGLTLAIAALAAITALAALGKLPPGRRTIAAALAALPYLGAAYLAQGAFKEPLQALLLITFALLLARGGPRLAIPVGVALAAAVYNYSFPGLFWLAGALILWWLLSSPSLRALTVSARAALPAVAVSVGLAVVLLIPEWTRIIEFTGFGAFDPAGEQTGLGNLRQAISPLEALGVWPTGEFRLSPADASLPVAAFYLAGLLGAVAVGFGVAQAIRRRHEEADGFALLAALASATVIYLGAAIAGTPYTSAKALAIAAPVAMLLALRALFQSWSAAANQARLAFTAIAVVFAAGAALSTFLALRQAPVAPPDHADELAEIRDLVEGEPVLFLGRDDFIAWHLRGAQVSTQIKNFFSTERVPVRDEYPEGEEKFDFDAVSEETLDEFDWVLTSSTSYASEPPENFTIAERTPSYVLWERNGPTEPREILDEDAAPGVDRPCDDDLFPTTVGVWRAPPVEGAESRWSPSATIPPGVTAKQTLELGRGTWEISLAYDAPRVLDLEVSGPGIDGERLELPANLDFRGPTPRFPATPTLEAKRQGEYEVGVALAEAPLAGRLLGAEGEAHLRQLVAVHVPVAYGRELTVNACPDYVDWYGR